MAKNDSKVEKQKIIEELEVLLPKEFYKQTVLQSSQRSPYAIFSPVEATKGKGWVNSTTPLSKPQKKSLIMDIQSFENCNNDYEKMGVVTSLSTLGFDIYIKKKNGSFDFFDSKTRITLTQLEARLKEIGTFSIPDDYTTLVNTYQLAHDDCQYIYKEISLYIQNKVLTEENVKKLNAKSQNIGCCLARLSPEDAVKELSSYGDEDYMFFRNKNIEINLKQLFINLLNNEYVEMAREMLNIESINGDIVFLKAAQKGVLDIVQKCIADGINVNTLYEEKNTALMYASLNKHHDVANLLISSGADIDIKEKNSQTALMMAVVLGSKLLKSTRL